MNVSKACLVAIAFLLGLFSAHSLHAAETVAPANQKHANIEKNAEAGKAEEGAFPAFKSTLRPPAPPATSTSPEDKLTMLGALLEQGKNLRQDAAKVQQAIEQSPPSVDTTELAAQLNALNQQLNESSRDFERIATGVELSTFAAPAKEEKFNWRDELSSLFDPMIKEMRSLTETTKKRADLKEEIATLSKQIEAAQQGVANLKGLREVSKDKAIATQLKELQGTWQNELERLNSKLQLAQMELQSLNGEGGSLIEKATHSVSGFFKTRGLYLILGFLAFALTFLLLRYLIGLLLRHLPKDKHGRPLMYARLITVFSHLFSFLLALIALLAVFYIVADWFMISLVILLVIGMLWGLRQTLPQQWQQSLLMLNMGAVREGERLVIDGVPWRIDSLGVFCRLSNPDLEQVLRLPIENMLPRISRPYNLDEPWFPCKKGDFIRVGDNTVLQVTSLSHEQVAVVRVGTAMATIYPIADFLALAVTNLSKKFSVSATFGLSYDLQAEITNEVPKILRAYLQKRLDEEGYSSKCLGMTCELSLANSSTLDMAVILEFEGEMASIYYRLQRAVQRWCVDCCTENGWDIPYNQIVVHSANPA